VTHRKLGLAFGGIQRPFTRLPNALHLGPTGARLWATYVHIRPGMEGSFEFVHKINLPRLFSISIILNEKPLSLELKSHMWYPSHMETTFENNGLSLTESKFITWDDCAVDVVKAINLRSSPVRVSLRVDYGYGPDELAPAPAWCFRCHGERVYVRS